MKHDEDPVFALGLGRIVLFGLVNKPDTEVAILGVVKIRVEGTDEQKGYIVNFRDSFV